MDEKKRNELGKKAAVDGFAHELILTGLLMKRYLNVSLVDLPLSEYDILVVFKDAFDNEIFIRVQSKTATQSVKFTGGTRGGADRTYKSDVKKYIQSPKTADVVIGITPDKNNNFDLYIVPTVLIEIFKTESKSIGQLQGLKNNFEMLEKSKDHKWVIEEAQKLGVIPNTPLISLEPHPQLIPFTLVVDEEEGIDVSSKEIDNPINPE